MGNGQSGDPPGMVISRCVARLGHCYPAESGIDGAIQEMVVMSEARRSVGLCLVIVVLTPLLAWATNEPLGL